MSRRLAAAAALFLLLGAGALAWILIPRDGPPAERPQPTSPPSVETAEPSPERLAAARRAAFPEGTTVYEDGLEIMFLSSRLLDAPFGPVLMSEGEVRNAYHGAPGVIAVHYLRPDGEGFTVAQTFPAAVQNGSNGRLSSWHVSNEFTELPVVYTEGGGTWQGHTCVVATLTELTPQGPRDLATVPLYYDGSGALGEGPEARSIAGRIVNVRRGQSFEVEYSGNERATDRYAYRDGRFVGSGEGPREWC